MASRNTRRSPKPAPTIRVGSDSGQALVNTDGSTVKTPIALVEIQGYVYDAWLRMAQIYDALGKSARAHALREKAQVLPVRFNDAFWDEESSFYAFCLDGDKKAGVERCFQCRPLPVVGHRALR